ncbi:unnamed protein product [Timema podura]|uniref:Uncharacterized protein n=1 Tax=Timema podura TaxID=61482 RepID=A0ABN7NW27_TIMPD|nr:unnamed protein product [Timema podura]
MLIFEIYCTTDILNCINILYIPKNMQNSHLPSCKFYSFLTYHMNLSFFSK